MSHVYAHSESAGAAYQAEAVEALSEATSVVKSFSIEECLLFVVVGGGGPELVDVEELVAVAERVALLVGMVAVLRGVLSEVIEGGVRAAELKVLEPAGVRARDSPGRAREADR